MSDQPPADLRVTPTERLEALDEPPPRPPACALVIFGATGDLTARKLIPALYNLFAGWMLPEQCAILGVGRRGDRASFLAGLRDAAARFMGAAFKPAIWDRFARLVDFVRGDPADPATVAELKAVLEASDRDRGTAGNRVFYLATPPDLFAPITTALKQGGLVYDPAPDAARFSRVIIEKPFGTDLRSAETLNAQVSSVLDESQVYRIDHYLGKETVQNILVLRFANSIFEPLWNRNHIEHVQITAAESIGVEGRGKFYDQAGALRDVVQNHVLQLLALTAIDPPVSFRADDVRDRKVELFRSLRPIRGEWVAREAVRAQYAGYRKEPGVAPDSRTPTYVALRAYVDNWRWQGVPFYIRAGKKLARRSTDIAIRFKRIPLCFFERQDASQMSPNLLRIRIQPGEGISLRFAAKRPGERLAVANIHMDMSYASTFGGQTLADAYERLILDCMRGDATLFERRDGVEQAWRFCTPILDAWDADRESPLPEYAPGSDGPDAADALAARDGAKWRPVGESA